MLAAVYSAVQLADGPLRDDAVQLLEDTMKEPGDSTPKGSKAFRVLFHAPPRSSSSALSPVFWGGFPY